MSVLSNVLISQESTTICRRPPFTWLATLPRFRCALLSIVLFGRMYLTRFFSWAVQGCGACGHRQQVKKRAASEFFFPSTRIRSRCTPRCLCSYGTRVGTYLLVHREALSPMLCRIGHPAGCALFCYPVWTLYGTGWFSSAADRRVGANSQN